MTFSLKVANGDLVQSGSQMAIVDATDKLRQDVTLWLAERIGIDRFHPAMGSQLQNYIGGIINFNTQSMVYAEVMRVLDNYQKVQFQAFRQKPTNFSLGELMYAINNVNVNVGYDSVNVAISVANAQQQIVNTTVSQGT
jgi:phage baseplate assembly protein W